MRLFQIHSQLGSVLRVSKRRPRLPFGFEGHTAPAGGGGGVLPCKRLIGMCRLMGSHFHDWGDYNEVAFSIDLLNGVANFRIFGIGRDSNGKILG